ncbi:MAG TPA: hypothetical protein DIW17_05620 [Clostridiales bacterium]|nr:transglutaminase domain-containing protein [Clostridia bacterium]HCS73336.1 hypothetical protein [Clostridiales bacterium]
METHVKRTLNTKRFITVIILFLLAVLGVYRIFRPGVVKTVTMEAGSSMVDVKEFLRDRNAEGSFVTNVQQIDINQPGSYEMIIQIGNKQHTSQLEIVDSVPPSGTAVDVMVLKGEELEASSFVKDVSDASDVTVSFARKPSTRRAGSFKTAIQLEDSSKNKTILDAQLTVLEVKESVQAEAGQALNLTSYDFVDHGQWPVFLISNLEFLDVSKPTEHKVRLRINGKTVSSMIKVVDTTPPIAVVSDQEIYLDQTLEADDFVSDIVDVSDVKCSFLRNPNFKRKGSTELTIVLEDAYGNKSQYPANLTIKDDNDPPVFAGIRDIIIFEGQAISYKKGVSAEDAKDGPVEFEVNSKSVNNRKPGVYEIQYTAEDAAGNIAEETARVTVKKLEPTEEAVYSLADEILDKIMKPEMTKKEMAYEIYKYVKRNVSYTGSSNKDNVIEEAFRAIKYKAGDCFTYYALGEVLLTRAEIDNMMVTRVGGKTQHFWSLINVGEGWYHFDTSKHSEEIDSFMMTDKDLEYYTKRWGRNYFVYDKSKYPETAKQAATPVK